MRTLGLASTIVAALLLGPTTAVRAQAPGDLESALRLVDYACYLARASDQLAGKNFPVTYLNALQGNFRSDVTIGALEEICTPVVKGDERTFDEALQNPAVRVLMHIDYLRHRIDRSDPPDFPEPMFEITHLNPMLRELKHTLGTIEPRALLTPVTKTRDAPVDDPLFQALTQIDYVCYAAQARDHVLPFKELDVLNLNPLLELKKDHLGFIAQLDEVCLPVLKGDADVKRDENIDIISEVDRANYVSESVGSLSGQQFGIQHVNPLFRDVRDEVHAFHISHLLTPVRKETTPPPPQGIVMWVNPLDLLAGDLSVTTSNDAVSSGVGGGLAGLVVESSTTGETTNSGGNKVIWMGLQVPPDWNVTAVRLCYELSSERSFVSQVSISQLQNPPAIALVLLDDPADLTAIGPICVDSQHTIIDPETGALFLALRVNFGDTADRIVVRGVGLYVVAQ